MSPRRKDFICDHAVNLSAAKIFWSARHGGKEFEPKAVQLSCAYCGSVWVVGSKPHERYNPLSSRITKTAGVFSSAYGNV